MIVLVYIFQNYKPIGELEVFDKLWYYLSVLCFFLTWGVLRFFRSEYNKLLEEVLHQKQQLEAANELLQENNEKIANTNKQLAYTNTELGRSNKELEEFAYIASHDLQEPLRMVGNFVQLLEEDLDDTLNEEQRSYIAHIVGGVTRMSDLIHDLLQYSRVGRSAIELKPYSPKKIIDAKLQDLSAAIGEAKAWIEVGAMPETIRCVPSQMGVVFHNLINNAVKFNKHKTPMVQINSEVKGSHHLFIIFYTK